MYNLLIVDDEKIIADGLQMAVRASGLPLKNVDVVYQAQTALNRIQTVPYDVILTDICMPGMDGFTLVSKAKKIWPRIKAIILTGNRNFDYVRAAMHLQCVDFLIKPIQDEQIQEALSDVISKLDREWMDAFSLKENETSIHGDGHGKDAILIGCGKEVEVRWILKQWEVILNPNLSTDLLLLCFRKNRMNRETIQTGIQTILNTMYGEKICAHVCPYDSNMLFYIIQYGDRMDGIRESLYKTLEEVQSILYEKQDVRMSVTIEKNINPKKWEERAGALYRRKENGFVCGELIILKGQDDWQESTGTDKIMEKIDYYIKSNLENDLTLGHLAQIFCFNSSYLSRIFHHYKGESLSSYIIRIRMERAKKLLVETDLKVYEIASKSGFETPAYFSRLFNRFENMSPKEYRFQYRKKE